MDTSDPPKNIEGSRLSRRRISSILKAPRKSSVFHDTEQEENEVERTKPVEKRNSRRVSFAPANDVLLFDKDVKNATPARSPLQELVAATAAAPQNRVQVAETDDRAQQIMGIENLLNAPLHASQQRTVVSFDCGSGFGEKTLMFSTEDAVMDFTHNHTININLDGDADVLGDPTSHQNVLLTRGEGRTADDVCPSAPLSGDGNKDSEPLLELDFENFLASLSKPSSSDRMAARTESSSEETKSKAQIVDKENQVPKSLSGRRSVGEPLNRSAFCPVEDVSVNQTEARAERNIGGGDDDDDDDPFQCLFPTQDMYAERDRMSSQTRRKSSGLDATKDLGKKSLSLPVHAPRESQKETLVTADGLGEKTGRFSADDVTQSHTLRFTTNDADMDMTTIQTGNIDLISQLSHPSVNFSLPSRDKTAGLAADEITMDITQCLTANIESNSVLSEGERDEIFHPQRIRSSFNHSSKTGIDNLFTSSSANPKIVQIAPTAGQSSEGFTIYPDDDTCMDLTEAQTGCILEGCLSADGTEHLQSLLPTQGTHHQSVNLRKEVMTSYQPSHEGDGSSAYKETSVKSSLKTDMQRHQVMFDAEVDSREKAVRFIAADTSMDITKSPAVNIITDLLPFSFPMADATKTVRFTEDVADMEVTQSHTVKVDLNMASNQNVSLVPANGEKTVRFTTNDGDMDVTRIDTANISARLCQNADFHPLSGDKTVRFTTNDASIEMTNCFTVNIDNNPVSSLDLIDQNVLFNNANAAVHPSSGDKTVRFTANDASIEMTNCFTVNIDNNPETGLDLINQNVLSCKKNVDFHPPSEDKTVRFSTNDASLEMTNCFTVNIDNNPVSSLDLIDQNVLFNDANAAVHPLSGDKTVRFTANDASIEMTNCFTVNIDNNPATGLDLINQNVLSCKKNVDFHPSSGDKTVRFTANDASIEMTNCFTVNIDNNPVSSLDLIDQNVLVNDANAAGHPSSGDKTVRFTANDASIEMTNCLTVNIDNNPATGLDLINQNVLVDDQNVDFLSAGPDLSSSAHLEQELKSSLSWKSGSLAKTEATDQPHPPKTADSNSFQLKTSKPETNAENESPGFVSDVVEQPENKTKTSCAETESGCLRPASTDNPRHNLSSARDNSEHLKKTGLASWNLETQGPPASDDVDSNKMETTAAETFPSSQMEPGDARDVSASSSRKSRRKSLADLQSKLRRLSNVLKAAPDTVAVDDSMAPLPQPVDPDPDKNSNDKIAPLPASQPELQTGLMNAENDTGAQSRLEKPSSAANATPFKLKTQQLMSTLSVSGFKPKLPQRNNPDKSKKSASAGEATRTFTDGFASRLRDFDHDVDNVFNEELGSCEDMSEMLDTRTPEKIPENQDPSKEFYMFDPLEDDFFKEPFAPPFHSQKRPLPEGEGDKNDEKRLKSCTEGVEMEFQPVVERDANSCTAQTTTQPIDSSNSSRFEAASESTFKTSLFESQLEDYSSDGQKKLKDGTITVMEFFNLFNIDFVTHNPRQSVLPDRFPSDAVVAELDLLRNKHINRPRQKIYEADIQILTTQVEELKIRLQDLNKPLRTVNRRLWEEMRNFSEKELKSFGAKLKERNNFLRKTSKVQSHQMKEVLYSNLVRVNQEEQQKLRGMITKADTMLKCLDDCVSGLEAEIRAVMEKDTEDKKSVKTLQEEFTKTSEALAENNRQISELELQKKQNSSKLNKMKVETNNLRSRIDTLNMLNEWRLREKKDGSTSFTFLHNTMILELLFQKPHENNADSGAEKITSINFKFDLDDETSQFHARLVHRLVSQHIEGESAWVEKYPTSRHVPKLLHDVSLVVSPCRLLGEELRLLKTWGSLRFDILDISSTGTQVRIVFSSLKKMSKFEVVFSVGLTNHICVFQVQSFKNKYGNTTIQQIEEIVASLTSDTKLFTKIVTKIHDTLLS